MRNLKRVLALALALVMTLGLMITASAASYADADQIDANYNEAIEVLTNMGVFRGQDNGGASAEFAPKDILTRAEAATLVYRLLTADVTDAKKSNYDYTSFDDVKEGEWWTGYITYAANGKYVVGYGNGKFGPNDQVTGIEVLTIMLRALGYGQNGEFVGGGWKDHVLTTANENGMLKGVATDDLDKGASRELVAQLLFNAITVPSMVNYAPLTGYAKTNQTLGNKNFGLVEIEGVVTGNEWADLYDTKPLATGKTEINGKVYSLSTDLNDIGESRRGWAIDSKVLFITDSGLNNILVNTGAATNLDSKFEKANGITDDTEYFLNFGREGAYTSDYRIAYVVTVEVNTTKYTDVTAANAAKTAADLGLTIASTDFVQAKDKDGKEINEFTYEISFKVGAKISNTHMDNIEELFSIADKKGDNYVTGEVYVGTKSTSDISDRISFKTFKAEYINDETYGESYSKTGNGDWLKVIDNDGDGEADYVLKTVYVLDEITSYSNRTKEFSFNSGLNTKTYAPSYLDGYEPEVGDVVIYALIDGNAYIELAETDVATIKTVNYRAVTVTTTDGDVYEQSDISNKTEYADDITAADEKVEYNLYFDKFGYLRAYKLVEGSTVYGLLTELYTVGNNNGQYVTNKTYIAELTAGEEKTAEYDVTNSKDNTFIGNVSWGSGHYANVLQRALAHLGLKEDGRTYYDEDAKKWVVGDEFDYGTNDKSVYTHTNVAKYVLTDDGVKLSTAAEYAYNKAGEQWYYTISGKTTEAAWKAAYAKTHPTATTTQINNAWVDEALDPVYAVDYVKLAVEDIAKGARQYDVATGYDGNINDHINAVHDTEYYLVTKDKITYFTDYTNMPAVDKAKISAIYAVAENTEADSGEEDYWVANVIVIELESWNEDWDSVSLSYFDTYKTTSEVHHLDTLNSQSETVEAQVVTEDSSWKSRVPNGFYALYDTEDNGEGEITAEEIERITENYNDYGIYAGTITRINKISQRGGYIEVNNGVVDDERVDTYDVPVYSIYATKAGSTTYNVAPLDADEVETGDRIIWVTDKKDNVSFIVDLTFDNNGKWYPAAFLRTEFTNIVTEQRDNAKTPENNVEKQLKAYNEFGKDTAVTADNYEEAVELLENMKAAAKAPDSAAAGDQVTELNKAIDALEKKINDAQSAYDLKVAKADAKKALEDYAAAAAEYKDVDVNDPAIQTVLTAQKDAVDACTSENAIEAIVKNDNDNSDFGTGILAIWGAASDLADAKNQVAKIGSTYYTDLASAVSAASAGDTITLVDDAELTAQLTIDKAITLDGQGHKITANGYKTSTAANNAGILVSAAGVTIKNLTVVGPNTNTGWDNGEYGIKVYAVDATLEDVTVTGANAGIQITGATLTLKGTIDVSGNEFGGIELAKNSSTSTAAVLDITNATLVNTTENPTPTAWADAEFDGTITGSGLRGVLNQGNSATQIYWFLAN